MSIENLKDVEQKGWQPSLPSKSPSLESHFYAFVQHGNITGTRQHRVFPDINHSIKYRTLSISSYRTHHPFV